MHRGETVNTDVAETFHNTDTCICSYLSKSIAGMNPRDVALELVVETELSMVAYTSFRS